ncbi:MAG: DUF1697 domain-containing protein [Bifidobacteriaceae bacterium]|nr:DUF1697 domain-containing protein [Bifidobacteriaceae bacterium]
MPDQNLVFLLRGVNLGAHRRLPMARLREAALKAGLDSPVTYLASGNLLARSSQDPDAAGAALRAGLRDGLGLRTDVIVRTADRLARIVADYPFPSSETRASHILFFSEAGEPRALAALLDTPALLPEQWTMAARETFLYLPFGVARSRLASALIAAEPRRGTMRGLRTVAALAEMAGD